MAYQDLIVKFSAELGDFKRALQTVQKQVHGAYADMGNDMIKSMSNMEKKMRNSLDDVADQSKKSANKMEKNMKGSMNGISKESSKMAKTVSRTLKGLATYFSIQATIDFAVDSMEAAGELNAMRAQYQQIWRKITDDADKEISRLEGVTGAVGNRLRPTLSEWGVRYQGLGMDAKTALKMAGEATEMAADAAAMYDMELETANTHLSSFINGNYEGGRAIGLFANDTQMAQYAVTSGVIKETKEWRKLDEATRQATRSEYAKNIQKQGQVVGQANRESKQYVNVVGNMKRTWQDFKGELMNNSGAFDGIVSAMDKLSRKMDGFNWNKFKEGVQSIKDKFSELKDHALPIFDTISSTLKNLWERIAGNGQLAEAASQTWDIIIGIFDAVAGVIEPLADDFMGVVDATQDMYKAMAGKSSMESFNDALSAIKGNLKWIADNGEVVAERIEGIIGAFLAFKTIKVVMAWMPKIAAFFGVIAKVGTAVMTAFSSGGIGAALATLGDILLAAIGGIPGLIVAAIALCVFLVIRFWDEIKWFFSKSWEYIKKWSSVFAEWCGKLWDSMKAGLGKFWNSMASWFSEMAGKIGAKLVEWKDAFVSFFGLNADTISEGFDIWWNNATNLFDENKEKVLGKLNEWKTSIGSWFVEKKNTLLDGLNEWWSPIGKWFVDKREMMLGKFQDIKDGIAKSFTDPNFLVDKLDGWTEKLNKWSFDKIDEMTGTLDTMKETIGKWFSKKKNSFVDGFSEWYEGVPKWFDDKLQAIDENLDKWKNQIGNWFSNKWGTFTEGFTKWYEGVPKWFDEKLEAIDTCLDKWKEGISKWFSDKWGTFSSGFSEWYEGVPTWFDEKLQSIQDCLGGWKDGIGEWFTEKKDGFVEGFKKWLKNLKEWFEGDGEKEVTKTGGKVAEKTGDGFVKKVKEPNMLKKIGDSILKLLGAVLLAIGVGIISVGYSICMWMWKGIKKGWGWLKNKFGEWGESMSGWFKKLPSKLGNAFSSTGKFLTNAFIKVINTAVRWFLTGINYPIKGINWIYKKITGKDKGLVGEINVGKWQIPELAKGTSNWQGGTALVGEAGRELVSDPRLGTFMANQPMLLPLSKHASVLRNSKTEKLLASMGIPAFASGRLEGQFGKKISKKNVGKGKQDVKEVADSIAEFVGDVWDYVKHPEKLIKKVMDKIGWGGTKLTGVFNGIWKATKEWAVGDTIVKWIKGLFKDNETQNWTGGAGGNWATAKGWAEAALKIMGYTQGTDAYRAFMQAYRIVGAKESNYNNSAWNKWDINAKRGTPSRGWLQFIEPTFNSYKKKGYNNWLDPIHQAVAFINYANKRYGGPYGIPGVRSIRSGGRYLPYANGGLITKPTMALMGEAGTEAVVPLSNARALQPFGQSVANNLLNGVANEPVVENPTYTFTIPVVVDGREIAKATATFTKEELDRMDKRDSRRRGTK